MISWEALPPEQSRPAGGVTRLAALVIHDHDENEYLTVPRQVANAIRRDSRLRSARFGSREELMSALESVMLASAKKSCLTLLQKRDYTKDELRKKIEEYGFSKSTALEVTNELERLGILNDVRFAEVFVRSKIGAGWGLLRIERELCRRGVDTSCIEGWPYAYIDPDDEFERAKEIASRKMVRPPNEFGKMVRFLMGRGFAQGVSIDAARYALGTE